MIKRIFVLLCFLIVVISLSGCFHFEERTYNSNSVSSSEVEQRESQVVDLIENDVAKAIENWIAQYNEFAESKFLIKEPTYSKNDDCYYVTSNGNTYMVILDENNDVVLFSLTNGSIDDQISVANAWLNTQKTSIDIPMGMFEYIENFKSKHSDYQDEISKYIMDYHSSTPDTPSF